MVDAVDACICSVDVIFKPIIGLIRRQLEIDSVVAQKLVFFKLTSGIIQNIGNKANELGK